MRGRDFASVKIKIVFFLFDVSNHTILYLIFYLKHFKMFLNSIKLFSNEFAKTPG